MSNRGAVAEGEVDCPTAVPEKVTYSSANGTEIAARLYTPEVEPIAGMIKPHGGPPALHNNSLDAVAQALVQSGLEVASPDFRKSIVYGRGFRKGPGTTSVDPTSTMLPLMLSTSGTVWIDQ